MFLLKCYYGRSKTTTMRVYLCDFKMLSLFDTGFGDDMYTTDSHCYMIDTTYEIMNYLDFVIRKWLVDYDRILVLKMVILATFKGNVKIIHYNGKIYIGILVVYTSITEATPTNVKLHTANGKFIVKYTFCCGDESSFHLFIFYAEWIKKLVHWNWCKTLWNIKIKVVYKIF